VYTELIVLCRCLSIVVVFIIESDECMSCSNSFIRLDILLYGQDANGGMFTMIHEVMSELIVLRRRLLSSALTQGQVAELKSRIASKIDWGNK